jgi:hypothetical protein
MMPVQAKALTKGGGESIVLANRIKVGVAWSTGLTFRGFGAFPSSQ